MLENFNVRTLYDKIEDQTLHISSQLSHHQLDLRGFYDRIMRQTEGLKLMLKNLDFSVLVESKKHINEENHSETEKHQKNGKLVSKQSLEIVNFFLKI